MSDPVPSGRKVHRRLFRVLLAEDFFEHSAHHFLFLKCIEAWPQAGADILAGLIRQGFDEVVEVAGLEENKQPRGWRILAIRRKGGEGSLLALPQKPDWDGELSRDSLSPEKRFELLLWLRSSLRPLVTGEHGTEPIPGG